jgi:hypothetical protein
VTNRIAFRQEGDFKAFHEAEAHVREESHVTGSMCGGEPIGFAPSEKYEYIAKWRNIPPADRKLVHGVIVPAEGGCFRNGPVEIVYFGDI